MKDEKKERFDKLVSKTLTYELGSPYREQLTQHVDALEEIYNATEETQNIFNYAIPAIIKSSGGGIDAVLKFGEYIKKGYNPWAASIASVSNPEPFFRRLTEEFELNDGFAKWVSNPESAAHNLWFATRGNPQWDAGEPYEQNALIQAWKNRIIEPVGKWPHATEYDSNQLTLSKDGYAVGAEIERRNRPEYHMETRTPHTTDLKAFEKYLLNVKQYFLDTQHIFPANHLWNMHLNLSLSAECCRNVVATDASYYGGAVEDDAELIARGDVSAIVRLLFYPSNPYTRNIHISHKAKTSNYTFIKPVTPVDDNHQLDGEKILDARCPERFDAARLEMKCASVWAGMDVDYLMDCIKMMHILSKHPEKKRILKQTLNSSMVTS